VATPTPNAGRPQAPPNKHGPRSQPASAFSSAAAENGRLQPLVSQLHGSDLAFPPF
jgi:hypothetical protein